MSNLRRLLLALAVVGLSAASASAQTIFGTFSWQMQPYCNSVTLNLISMPTGFTVEGIEDQCGGPNKGSAVGTAAFNASGNLLLNFTIGLPGSRPVQVSAFVSPANGEGTWNDGYGNTGTFKFFGATPGLPPRPINTVTAVSGQVLAGDVSLKYSPGTTSYWELASVSFPSPLPAGVATPIVEYVPGAVTTTCPGVGQAAAGRLCVYSYNTGNVASVIALAIPSTGRYGVPLYVTPATTSSVAWLIASWAYRVP